MSQLTADGEEFARMLKCVYARYHDDRPPCCTHECDGCLWYDEVEVEEDET